MIYDETIAVLRPGTTPNRYDDDEPSWETPTRVTYSGVSVQPSVRQEPASDTRDATVDGWRVISGDGVDIDVTAADRVEIRGVVHDVVGDVARWPDPVSGGVDHVEFDARKVEG